METDVEGVASEIATLGVICGPSVTQKILFRAADALRTLSRENAKLHDRVWALDRATHNHDEMEPEDG